MSILLIIIGLSLLILVHELGHFFAAKVFGVKVEEFGIGLPPRLGAIRKGETEYSINALPIGGFVKLYGEDGVEARTDGDAKRAFATQAAWKRVVMLSAGVLMNIMFAWLAISIIFMIGMPQHLVITDVMHGAPAADAGLQQGDVVLMTSVADEVLSDPITADEFVMLVDAHPDAEFSFTVLREGNEETVAVTGRADPPEGEGSLGVVIADAGFEQRGFVASLWAGAETTVQMLGAIVQGFVVFFSKVFIEPKIAESIAGPVGIVAMAHGAASLGVLFFVQLIAIISLNLAILNLIPFPALDGGRILMVCIEKVIRKPIPYRVQMIVNAVGFIVLLALMALVTIQDVGRFL